MNLTIGPDILREYEGASRREWLVTNGLGGYASGSLSGANTRRYHGLLIAALIPPTGRMALLSKLEEIVVAGGQLYELSANQYPGALHPQGWQYLERFDNYPAPTFLYRPIPGLLLEKRIWMAHGEHTTFVRYKLIESTGAVDLRLAPLVCWKDFHAEMHPWEGLPSSLDTTAGETRIRFTPDSPILRLLAKGSHWEAGGYWHYNVEHQRELERGLDFREDLYCPGHFQLSLKPGAEVTFVATIETKAATSERAWAVLLERQAELIAGAKAEDDFARCLALAADQFSIEGNHEPSRPSKVVAAKRIARRSTIIAGYHWFSDWGRDTMIALPGLCLETGRFQLARDILTSFAGFVSEGMLPNRFPDQGEFPEYNTVDATLWYFEAIRRYVAIAPDGLELAREFWPVLADIFQWHIRGTRYGIQADRSDGLLRAGQLGVQLTWMDARVGDWVVTPRMGKPVEINALWFNALRTMEQLAEALGEPSHEYAEWADLAATGFRRAFVRPDGQGLYDVITKSGPDASIRPNQIFAASLHYSSLTPADRESVVRVVAENLLTPRGIRTLSPADSAYRARYEGGIGERDSAYHQGTVWPWLLGSFVEAHLKVHNDPEKARAFLRPLQEHLLEAGVGSISEVFDGDAPHLPDGCIAQAWSVAEVLRAWNLAGKANDDASI